jgi:uncharacterized protein
MPASTAPLNDREIAELDELLGELPAPLEPLDAVSLDGYLCGVLLQPRSILPAQWLRFVLDVDGRAAPASPAVERIAALAARRHAELNRAIDQRQWFDPWIFELDDADSPQEAVLPWVAGFAGAMDHFPALTELDSPELLEPLAVLYAAFDPDDLEDADELLAVIETLEPPSDMAEAVEDLVRSVLLLADISRPRANAARRPAPRQRPRPGPRR